MKDAIRAELEKLAEPGYASFAARLLPGEEDLLGVRLPHLRRIARRLAKGDWDAYLASASDASFEEIMLQGMVIGYIDAPAADVLPLVRAFTPKIANWSVCDSFCCGLKLARREPDAVWEFLTPYFSSPVPYDVRFAAVMLLFHYINEARLSQDLSLLEDIRHPDYYVKMAVAWAVSMCYISFPEQTLSWLLSASLDDFTYNKSIQKICESNQVDIASKRRLRTLRR